MTRDSIQSLPKGHTAAAAVSSAAKSVYTCPMHPEVQQDHPGACPKCGMALEVQTVSGPG